MPLLIAEDSTARLQALARSDPVMAVWWASEVECISALTRLEREGLLTADAMAAALGRLEKLAARWHQIDAADSVKETAARFLRVHPLRAADALQLAAAFLAANRQPNSFELVTRDERLGLAARKEGFVVLDGSG